MSVFRIVTKQGSVIDIQHTALNFNFKGTVGQMKINGYFQNDSFHIAYNNVAFCAYGPDLPTVAGVQYAPSTETKQ